MTLPTHLVAARLHAAAPAFLPAAILLTSLSSVQAQLAPQASELFPRPAATIDTVNLFSAPSFPVGDPWLVAPQSSGAAFMSALDSVASRSAEPNHARRSLLAAIHASNLCYRSDLSPQEFEQLIIRSGLLPAADIGRMQPRFNLAGQVWTGDLALGANGQATRARLTYSFPPDGTLWGTDTDFIPLPNSLNSTFTTNFGAVDIGREWVRQSFAGWKRIAGITYDEVGDSGIPMDTVTTRRTTVGDTRIGGYTFLQADGGTDLAGVLAYNNFPSNGSDMALDIAEFTASRFMKPDDNFRYFRNVVSHEHGHGLGFIHQVPCDATKLMEPLISTAYDVLQIDDRRGAGSAYGDRFSGNNSVATAADLGTFNSLQQSRLERDLSINGLNGPNGSGQDWFKFVVPASASYTLSMAPTGGTYTTGAQSGATSAMPCNGSTASTASSSAGDLDLELYDSTGTNRLAQSTAGAGVTENITQTLAAGTYYVRVFDFGPNSADKVQLYNLQVGITGTLYNPYANAGVNKRINVGELCQFMGDVNSISGLLPINSYQWDLDGNGSLETVAARPITIYTTPGIRTVRLTIVDQVGHNANDFITVTVIGSAPTVSSVSPNNGIQGNTVPVTINGSSLGSPTVSVSGTGVTVTGTPSVDLTNPSAPITGLSFVIDPLATAGLRNVIVTTPSGTTTATNAFQVVQAVSTISSVSPNTGVQGQSYPLTINGTNFNGTVSVSISGTGVTFSGTAVVNPARTQITGLTAVISPTATVGARTLTVTSAAGAPTATFTVTAPTTSNDLCSSPASLQLNQPTSGNTSNATTDGSVATTCTSSSNKDVYYAFTPPCSGSYTFQTSPSTLDTVLSVHSGCPATAATALGCNDDIVTGGSDLSSRLSVSLTGGTLYIVRVAAFGSTSGGVFSLTATPTPLANDLCANAAPLPVGTTPFNSCTADSESVGTISCATGTADLWYTFTAAQTGRTTIDTCGSSFDSVLEITPAPCGSGSIFPIVCNDDSCGTASRVDFVATAGVSYIARVQKRFVIQQGAFGGPGTITRYCPADFNLSGQATVQDIFDFLSAWFAANPRADFNGVGGISVQDIFDFLAAWFAGCT